jgi:hypothetical protein
MRASKANGKVLQRTDEGWDQHDKGSSNWRGNATPLCSDKAERKKPRWGTGALAASHELRFYA